MRLEVNNLSKSFGGIVANHNVDLTLEDGETLGLIGPNGAGKTTLFNCITSVEKTTEGTIILDDIDITRYPAFKVCRMGIARTFQVVQTFRRMTVLENVMIGAFLRTNDLSKSRAKAEEVLELTGLSHKKDALGTELTIGDMKRVEITRALATEPGMLFLDENMAGLNQVELEQMIELVRSLQKQGLSILIVEHVMEALLPLVSRIVVMDSGKVIAEGVPDDVMNDAKVIEAYLGEEYHAKS